MIDHEEACQWAESGRVLLGNTRLHRTIWIVGEAGIVPSFDLVRLSGRAVAGRTLMGNGSVDVDRVAKVANRMIEPGSDMRGRAASIEQFESGFHISQRLTKDIMTDWKRVRRHSHSEHFRVIDKG